MLHEKPVEHGPLGGDVEGTNMAWKREKRRRKHLTQPSSSDAPTATAQGHQAPIPYVLFGPDNAAKDHQGPISDMAIVQAQDHELLQERSDWGQQEEGGEELFGPDVILSEEDQARDAQKLLPNIRPPIDMYSMCWIDNRKVKVRQGRYRIAYYKAMYPESGRKLKDPDAYSEDELGNQEFFKHLEDDFEWFFHTDDSWIPDLGDYERIVLKHFLPGRLGAEYRDVNGYHELYHTYEMDAVYVKYYGEISKKIKWIEGFLRMDTKSAEWRGMKLRGWRQALRIATQLPHMTLDLAALAYNEYIWELRVDVSLKDLDLVFFEIWRLVIKDNRDYMDAVKEVYGMDKFHNQKLGLEDELEGTPVFCTMKRRIHRITSVHDIDINTEDEKARDLFRMGVAGSETKNMVKYAEKRMEIGERLNLHKRTEIPGPGRTH